MKTAYRPVRILVVDEDRETLSISRVFLKRQGIEVETSPSGKSALRNLMNGYFDVVLISLECGSTYDVEDFIRNVRDVWPSQKWLVMSSDPKGADAKRISKDLEVLPILAKPLSVRKVNKAVQKVCNLSVKGGSEIGPLHERDLSGKLTTLHKITTRALEHLNYADLFREFSDSLSSLVPGLASGVLGLTQYYNCLYIHSCLSREEKDLFAEIRKRLDRQLRALGAEAPVDVPKPTVTHAGADSQVDLPSSQCILSAPVTGGQGRLEGFIFVALPGSPEANASEMDTLYLAAHHLSTLLRTMSRGRELSMWDPVTGLQSRGFLDQSLPRIWELAETNDHALGVISIDLDDFTKINTRYGFSVGDRIMRDAAERMQAKISNMDLLVRQLGDSFLILVTEPQSASLRKIAEDIHASLTREPYPYGKNGITLGATVAGAMSGPQSGISTSQQLFDVSNRKLHELKIKGGNQVALWSRDSDPEGESLKRRPVLVVDDDPQVAKLLKKMMGPETVDMTCVLSVDEAEALLKEGKRFDVLLTDISMPGRDGFDMLRVATHHDPDMLKMVTSGNISTQTEQLLADAGCDDLIRKPFKLQDLRNRFSAALQDYARKQRKRRSTT